MHRTGFQAGHEMGPTSTEEIAELFDVVGRESETIRQLSGCVEHLREVQVAKRALLTVSPAAVRAALEYRRTVSGEPS